MALSLRGNKVVYFTRTESENNLPMMEPKGKLRTNYLTGESNDRKQNNNLSLEIVAWF